ncbi:GSCOCG00013238001-RA-CDS [Cotesia congregata]|uniref:Similar to Pex11b: Peroxisomal membrane protein 11B (Mus musculus) n=1 Tax=Cotesia congregata TaxID=51543 RepID=A0A8J2HGW7_COTCN|nr:GSCOCG00013238001-RA-CDS [Cotesia congregata]CAG5094063.1 Similar to Pex11b: Peroxisomal membrane protein 11B (Mus musculus) [Cotesia congregata]
MDLLIRLNNQTVGRDKIIRLCQYGSRAGWYYTQNKLMAYRSNDILKSLEYTFSSFRKLLRLGRFLDSLYSALSSMKYPNLVIRITLTLSKISNALYLLADHIIWVGRAGLCKVNIEKWSTIANKYWLMTIIMNLTRDIYEILQIMEEYNLGRLSKVNLYSKNYRYDRYRALFYLTSHKDVVLDTIKNGCDLFIPLTNLGYTKFTPGIVGILGFISSAVGIYCLIDPLAKLSPA